MAAVDRSGWLYRLTVPIDCTGGESPSSLEDEGLLVRPAAVRELLCCELLALAGVFPLGAQLVELHPYMLQHFACQVEGTVGVLAIKSPCWNPAGETIWGKPSVPSLQPVAPRNRLRCGRPRPGYERLPRNHARPASAICPLPPTTPSSSSRTTPSSRARRTNPRDCDSSANSWGVYTRTSTAVLGATFL